MTTGTPDNLSCASSSTARSTPRIIRAGGGSFLCPQSMIHMLQGHYVQRLICGLILVLCGCEAPQLNELSLSPAAKEAAIGMVATVPLEVAREIERDPASLPYFQTVADKIDALAETRKCLYSADPLRATIASVPGHSKRATKIVRTGARFYLGSTESHFDAFYVLAALAQAIRTGTTEPLANIKVNFRYQRTLYAMQRAHVDRAGLDVGPQFAGSPPTPAAPTETPARPPVVPTHKPTAGRPGAVPFQDYLFRK